MYVKALQKYGTSVSKHQSADCVPKTIVASVTLSILTVQKKNLPKRPLWQNLQEVSFPAVKPFGLCPARVAELQRPL